MRRERPLAGVPGRFERSSAEEPAFLDVEEVCVVALDPDLQVELDRRGRVVGQVVVLVQALVDRAVEAQVDLSALDRSRARRRPGVHEFVAGGEGRDGRAVEQRRRRSGEGQAGTSRRCACRRRSTPAAGRARPWRPERRRGTARRHGASEVAKSAATYPVPVSTQPSTATKCQCRPIPSRLPPGRANHDETATSSSSETHGRSVGTSLRVNLSHSAPGVQWSLQYSFGSELRICGPLRMSRPMKITLSRWAARIQAGNALTPCAPLGSVASAPLASGPGARRAARRAP